MWFHCHCRPQLLTLHIFALISATPPHPRPLHRCGAGWHKGALWDILSVWTAVFLFSHLTVTWRHCCTENNSSVCRLQITFLVSMHFQQHVTFLQKIQPEEWLLQFWLRLPLRTRSGACQNARNEWLKEWIWINTDANLAEIQPKFKSISLLATLYMIIL